MSVYVPDASVALKWLLPEVHSDAAQRLLQADHQFLAPDLLFAEVTSALWKRVRRGELSRSVASQLLAEARSLSLETIPCRVLVEDALALAIAMAQTPYDCVYVALAVRLKTELVTADQRLFRALAASPSTAMHVRMVSDF